MKDERARYEADLVRRCAEGERHAFAELVGRFGALIRAQIDRLLARRSPASPVRHEARIDRLAGDVWMALLANDRFALRRYDPAYRLSTYLGVICRREVLREE